MRKRFTAGLAVAAVALGSVALVSELDAQTRPLEQKMVNYQMRTGVITNNSSEARQAFSREIAVADAPWVRLSFERAALGKDSYLRITSLLDGAVQHLDAVSLAQWKNTTAYFNGSQVRLELIAGPGTTNEIVISNVLAGIVSPPQETQCGPNDDRVASNEPERARLLDIGCSAAIYNTESCFVTAGHCLSTGFLVDVAEFNVPLSNGNGSLNHPGPEDQYAVDSNTEFVNGGVGNDWGLFRVFPNSETGLMPFEAQGAHLTLADSVPNSGTVDIYGYGVDDGSANQTQQFSTGPITSASGTTLSYQADTEGGNSGSAVTNAATDEVIAIHTHGGCFNGGGANSGTQITRGALQDAIASFCPVGGIRLDSLTPSQAGVSNDWNYSSATPFGQVTVTCVVQGGSGIDITIGTSTADATGSGSVDRVIPGAGSGRTIECRASDDNTGVSSGLAIFAIQ